MLRHKRWISQIFLATALLTSACGGNDAAPSPEAGGTESPSSTEEHAAIESRLNEYFSSETPDEACESMTLGLQAFVDDRSQPDGDPAAPADEDCPGIIRTALDRGTFVLEDAEMEIEKILVAGDRAAVRILVPSQSDKPYAILLVKSGEDWLVAAEGFAPPGFQDLFTDVLAS